MPPRTPRSGKFLTHPKVLAYTYIAVTFQLRSSINVRLTERVCTKISPKVGLGAKIFGGKVHLSFELCVFRHLWPGSDAPCSPIYKCDRQMDRQIDTAHCIGRAKNSILWQKLKEFCRKQEGLGTETVILVQ